MNSILFITPYANGTAGSQRFRFEQFMDELEKHDISYRQIPFIDKRTYNIMYKEGHWIAKAWGTLKGFTRRLYALFLVPYYDVIFIHREGSPIGIPVIEFIISRILRKPYIYDFDDAIWRLDISETNKILGGLRYSSQKIPRTIQFAAMILAGNDYLANYARKYNDNVHVFPTIVDTDYHKTDIQKRSSTKICIGWTGTHTTLRHFEMILPQLVKLYSKYKDQIYFKLIVNADIQFEELDLTSTRWQKKKEIHELGELDIGLMPLPDNEWSNGKCGFKAIQYMSMETACVASAVGVNSQIIDHGTNGWLVNNPDQFYKAIETLILDTPLRQKLGRSGREKIKSQYSKKAQLTHFLNCLSDGFV